MVVDLVQPLPVVEVPAVREVTYVEDATREKRLREIVRRLAAFEPTRDIVRKVAAKYGVPRARVEEDFKDLAAETRRRLDDEESLDATMLYVVGSNEAMAREMQKHALDPLVPDDAKDGLPLTPAERATLVAAKANAAKTAASLRETNVNLLSRRSTRWSPKPQVNVNVDAKDLSPEQQEAMRRLMGE